jgi:hypothetical protein
LYAGGTWFECRAIAQAVSRRLPTATAQVRARVRSCGICGGQMELGQVFSEYYGFPCQFSFHRLLYIHHHLSSAAGTIGRLVAAKLSGLSLTPPQETKKKRKLHGSNIGRVAILSDECNCFLKPL